MLENNSYKTSEKLFDFVIKVQQKLVKPSETIIKENLTPSHFYTLSLLDKKPMIRNDISRDLEISKQQLTPVLNKLLESNYITRSKDDLDKRATLIEITESGRNFLHSQDQFVLNYLKEKLSSLSEDDIKELEESIKKLNTILEKI